tara:strand:- start:4233 stop:5030 length:798 start_codon:yes stop_codon:yes gene_type:complete
MKLENQHNVKLVILAGGYGTRISEESYSKPKPMIEIGGKPIIWHIMKYYSAFGINNFIVCAGYKSHMIKEYFNNFFIHNNDVNFIINNNKVSSSQIKNINWNVKVVDTGLTTMTGGRIKKIKKYLKNDDFFLMTYGDGLSNIDISKTIRSFKNNKKLALVSAVKEPSRFGIMQIKKNIVSSFNEKPDYNTNERINGGFFVLSTKVTNLIKDSKTKWEDSPLRQLTKSNNLLAHKHNGFWHPMDTLRDKIYLEKLWNENRAPWKIW